MSTRNTTNDVPRLDRLPTMHTGAQVMDSQVDAAPVFTRARTRRYPGEITGLCVRLMGLVYLLAGAGYGVYSIFHTADLQAELTTLYMHSSEITRNGYMRLYDEYNSAMWLGVGVIAQALLIGLVIMAAASVVENVAAIRRRMAP